MPSNAVWQRVLALVPLLFGLWYFLGLAPYGLHVGEDGDVLYEAFATFRGQLPYIDFSTGYTPGYFYWHAALFHLFGVDALVLRIAAAVTNALTLWLLYVLAARVVRPGFALLPPLVFAASLPVYPGEFCSFNVPYPAWYNITFWLASIVAIDVYARRDRARALLLAGLLAGLNFAFKPNVGLFNVAALSVFLAWWHAPGASTTRLERAAWWTVTIATLAGTFAIFGIDILSRRFALFPLPFLAAAGVLLVVARHAAGRPRFMRAACALFLGFALPNVSWFAYFLAHLGIRSFSRDVLLIGSSYEQFFSISYRELFSRWDLGVLLVAGALYVVPLAIRRRRLPFWAPFAVGAVATALAAAYVVFFAPMREGFQASVVSRIQDLAFFLVPLTNWAGLAFIGARSIGAHRRLTESDALLTLLIVSGPALSLGMHPRSDFMHLLISAPATIIVGTVLLEELARHWQDAMPDRRHWRWAVSAALAAPVVAVAVVLAAPGVGLAARLYSHYLGLRPDALARLDLPHATLVREPGEEREFTNLHAIATYVGAHTRPNDYVFPFPNLSLICFLSGRLNPTAKGYFIAGYPDHYTEAAIVTDLRDRVPAMIVNLAEHQIFVLTAPAYYFLIREFVRDHFTPAAQIGPYLVMARNSSDPRPIDVRITGRESSWAGLDDPDPNVQLETAARIERWRDPRGAAALARRAVSRQASNRIAFLRIALQFADERAVPPFLQIASRDYVTEAGQLATTALYFIAEKSLTEHFWLASDAQRERLTALRYELGFEPFRSWLRNRRGDSRLRYVAAWAAGVLQDDAAVPYLEKALESDDHGFARMASFSLVALGKTTEVASEVVAAFDIDDIYAPSILIDLYHRDPESARAAIEIGLQTGTPKARATLSWVVAALRDRKLAEAVAELDDDSDERVREAAIWSVAWLHGAAPPMPSAEHEGSAPASSGITSSAVAAP
ncbi:MAG: glycosyltransferase family 39 protein [Deltaproteobacteria bacterium]|nr:glycosyltransferase family 39 protein [Deltaproteobacteria bacterium]